MNITITRTADGRTGYAFGLNLIHSLAIAPYDAREDAISELAAIWVAENEGYCFPGHDRMVEALEEELSYQVEMFLDLNPLINPEHQRCDVDNFEPYDRGYE